MKDFHKKLALALSLAGALFSIGACAGAAPALGGGGEGPSFLGSWLGALDLGATKLKTVVNFSRAEDGSWSATLDSPDQGAWGIPADMVAIDGRKMSLAVTSIGAMIVGELSADGKSIAGEFSQGGMKFKLVLAKLDAPLARGRPQDPLPPFPYSSTELSIPGGAEGVTLAGTLLVPAGKGPFKAVVLVTGSGPQDRDEALMGHRPFLVLADALARAGIASFRYDDRGVGASTGSFAGATSADFAKDALAAANYLRGMAGSPFSSVGIAGHSEGGLIAPMAAGMGKVDFVVLLAGPAVDGEAILLSQGRAIAKAMGASEADIEEGMKINRKLYAALRGVRDPATAEKLVREILGGLGMIPAQVDQTVASLADPWMLAFIDYDPLPALEALKVPALALYGTKDLQVISDLNAPVMEKGLAATGIPASKVLVFPELNHLFQHAGTGAPSEYGDIAETMSVEVLKTVAEWIGGL